MLLGISSKAPQKEKIKSDYESLIRGFNMTGDIDYSVYSQLFEWGMPLFDEMYELGKKEAIKWHKYPEEKPNKKGEYLISLKNATGKARTFLESYDPKTDIWCGSKMISCDVIAWAERPEPYKEEPEDADSD